MMYPPFTRVKSLEEKAIEKRAGRWVIVFLLQWAYIVCSVIGYTAFLIWGGSPDGSVAAPKNGASIMLLLSITFFGLLYLAHRKIKEAEKEVTEVRAMEIETQRRANG